MWHNHQFWWRFFPRKELAQVYLSAAIRSFAISLLGLFVPLYLYVERGFSLEQTLLFFVFFSLVFALATPMAAKFAAQYGVKHSVLFSIPFYLAFIILLHLLSSWNIPLVLISACLGISLAFYWMGMHLVFYHASDHHHRGEEVGKREAISIAATMVGPLTGGFLIAIAGFAVVFWLSSILLLVSGIVLFRSKEEHIRFGFSWRSLLDTRAWRDDLYFASTGMRAIAAGVIWPLFIFVILQDYFSLGVVEFLLAGISALLVWAMGKYSDRSDKRTMVRRVVWLEAVSWVGRGLVSTVAQVFGITVFGAVSYGLMQSPLGALEYDKAKGKVVAYFVNREIFICIGRILLLSFVLLTNSLSGGLIFNGIGMLAAWWF